MALSKNEKYTFAGVTDLGEMNFNSCQNCSRSIRYVAELKTSTGKSVFVGTECAKNLSKYNIGKEWSMFEQLQQMKKLSTAINLLSKGTKIKIWGDEEKESLTIIGLNSRGNAKKLHVKKLFDVFLEKDYSFISKFIVETHKKFNVITDRWCIYDYLKYFDSIKKPS